MKFRNWNDNNIQEALDHIMKKHNLKSITSKTPPKEKFTFKKALKNMISDNKYQLLRYPSHWTYVTIDYRIVDKVGYVENIEYEMAV